jgi:hypothetical protein
MVLELLRQRASIREVRGPGGRGGSSFLPGSGCGCGYENPEANTVTCGFPATIASSDDDAVTWEDVMDRVV